MEKEIGKLIIVRHPESEWNKLGLWTGKTEVHLTEYGFQMAEKMGEAIKDFKIDRVFCVGFFCETGTPLPIPNREVKRLCADGTWTERSWESRTKPTQNTRFFDT